MYVPFPQMLQEKKCVYIHLSLYIDWGRGEGETKITNKQGKLLTSCYLSKG